MSKKTIAQSRRSPKLPEALPLTATQRAYIEGVFRPIEGDSSPVAVARRVRALREVRGWSVSELAARAGIARDEVALLEALLG